jgi:3-oxoadipate enol-lactonase
VPRANINGIDLSWVEHGKGPKTVVFSHSYLADHRHFAAQIEALASRYRVIAYDHRDHGDSGRAAGPYEFQSLVDDAVALIRHVDAAPCHFVGLSTGGFIATRLLVHHAELVDRVVIMDAAGGPEPKRAQLKYQGMFAILRLLGIKPLLSTAMKLMFGASSFADASKQELLSTWRERFAANDPQALIRFGNAIFGRGSIMDALPRVNRPVMVMVGEEDRPQPVSVSRRLAAAIPGARLEIIPRAGHLSTLEQPELINAALLEFLGA